MTSRHKKAPKTTGNELKLRIIGGQWRGRNLPFPSVDGLRPSGSRIRETLFNWLMPLLPGSRCLDLYAGSGALGLEALSRGASHCHLMELNAAASQQLIANAQTLKTTAATIARGDTLTLLKAKPEKAFDIAFIDPPFSMNLWEQTAALLELNGWLNSGAHIYVETPKDTHLHLPANWTPLKQKIAGQVSYRLYCNENNTSGSQDE